MTTKDEDIISGALKIFIYTNDLLCNPTAYDLELMELNYNNVIGKWAFCNLFLSEYLINIKNIELMLVREVCKQPSTTTEERNSNTHLFIINVGRILPFEADIKSRFGLADIEQFIKDHKNKNKIIVAPVLIIYPESEGGELHETALIIDPSRKTIDYFDPMYDIGELEKLTYRNIYNYLREQVGHYFLDWTWYSMEELGNHPGWQSATEHYRENDTALKQNYLGGYCVSWCILYAILKSIVSYAPVDNTGELILRLFPTAASALMPDYDPGYIMHIIIRNFALELILSLFEKDQPKTSVGPFVVKASQKWERIEPKEDSCGIDRITHASQEIIEQLRKENVRNKRSVADRARSKNSMAPAHHLTPNVVSHPNLPNTTPNPFQINPFNTTQSNNSTRNLHVPINTNSKMSEYMERLSYIVKHYNNFKSRDDLKRQWNSSLSSNEKEKINNSLVQAGYEPLPMAGFIF